MDDDSSSHSTYSNEIEYCHVHRINQERKTFGEYHHLFLVLKNYPSRFKQYMRMVVTTFDYLLSKIKNDLQKSWCNFHSQPILPEEQLVITIKFLSTGVSYTDLLFAFRMGTSTIYGVITRTMEILWKKLYPLHMPVPREDQLLKIAEEFYTIWTFPHCIGAIDVRHIGIKKPPNSGSMYYNYKKFFSITLQCVVDARYKFISIDVGGYGRQHDSESLKSSKFFAAIQKNIITIPKVDKVPNSTTISPFFFIGDGAYPLTENLQKPYPGVNLSRSQREFNKRLSRARLVVDCAFGKLCQKWQIFYKTLQCSTDTAELIAKSTCVLHNLIIDVEQDNMYSTDATSLTKIFDNSDDENNCAIGSADKVRETLKAYLMQNPI